MSLMRVTEGERAPGKRMRTKTSNTKPITLTVCVPGIGSRDLARGWRLGLEPNLEELQTLIGYDAFRNATVKIGCF